MKAEVDRSCGPATPSAECLRWWCMACRRAWARTRNWDERLDGLLAQAVMSLQAVKAVEIGRGVTAAESLGSAVHDAIGYGKESDGSAAREFTRERNNAGGIEGGISNGEDVVVRGYLKPISTLRRPLAVGEFCDARAGEGGV